MRLHAPAAERNAGPILEVLAEVLPKTGSVLEVASGTGQHCAHFATALPGLTFQPTDLRPEQLTSIAAWCEGLPNVLPPIGLDTTQEPWPVASVDAVWCANMIHIAPPEACTGLLRGAGEVLPPGGLLVLYGPFRVDAEHTAPSNAAFEAWLKEKDPRYGVRDRGDVAQEAAEHGLSLERGVEMPANNMILVFRRISSGED